MTDRGIAFSTPMVRSLLKGEKTQTRRLASSPLRKCVIGDRLWVREEWHAESWYDRHPAEARPGVIAAYRQPLIWYPAGYWLELASGSRLSTTHVLDLDAQWSKGVRRPGMHMPRWASRLTLFVEDVKVEQLQDITEADAKAEGAARLTVDDDGVFREHHEGTFRCGYAGLWNHLHKDEGEHWDDNPSVVALTFGVRRCNIDQVAA